MSAQKVRDMDKTITGLLFHPEFLYSLLMFFLSVMCAGVVVYLFFFADAHIATKIFISLLFLFVAGDPLTRGIKHFRTAWNDWRSYCKEEE